MSATGCLFLTILPPIFSMLLSEDSMSATSTVITVFLTSLSHLVIPPLIAPGISGHLGLLVDGCCAYRVVLHSGVLANLPSECFLVECFAAFQIVERYFEVYYFAGDVRHMRHYFQMRRGA